MQDDGLCLQFKADPRAISMYRYFSRSGAAGAAFSTLDTMDWRPGGLVAQDAGLLPGSSSYMSNTWSGDEDGLLPDLSFLKFFMVIGCACSPK